MHLADGIGRFDFPFVSELFSTVGVLRSSSRADGVRGLIQIVAFKRLARQFGKGDAIMLRPLPGRYAKFPGQTYLPLILKLG